MTGRAYIGEMLIQIWLKSMHGEMSELVDKQVNVQKESLKKLPGFTRAHEKVCDENERKKETNKQRKKDGRLKYFLMEEGVY